MDAPFAFEGHVRAYKRELQCELHRRPTDVQRALMTTAAIARARFDQASRDHTVKPADLAHFERVARKATAAARASFPASGRGTPASIVAAGFKAIPA